MRDFLILVLFNTGQSSSQVSENDRKANQYSETNFGNPTVDPLVVNFEEGMQICN